MGVCGWPCAPANVPAPGPGPVPAPGPAAAPVVEARGGSPGDAQEGTLVRVEAWGVVARESGGEGRGRVMVKGGSSCTL